MENCTKVELLQGLRFSAGLPLPVLAALAAVAELRHYDQGAVLFKEGILHDELYLVADGRVGLEMHVPGRGAVRILTLGSGELLGWSPVLGDGRMTATAAALDPAHVVVLPARAIRDLCQADHEAGFQIMRYLASAVSRRLVATRLQLLDLYADASPKIKTEPACPPDRPACSTAT